MRAMSSKWDVHSVNIKQSLTGTLKQPSTRTEALPFDMHEMCKR